MVQIELIVSRMIDEVDIAFGEIITALTSRRAGFGVARRAVERVCLASAADAANLVRDD